MSFENLNINFNSETMQFEVGPPEWQRKASLIADISTIQQALNKGPVTLKQWDEFIEMSIEELTELASNQDALLERIQQRTNPPSLPQDEE